MKITFPLPTDGGYHEYCAKCQEETPEKISEGGQTLYICHHCGEKSARAIIIDPQVKWWVDQKTKEYWHESVGVFVFDQAGRVLFFEHARYAFAFTIPAGHLDVGENSETAAKRELAEETGLKLERIQFFCREDIARDQCRRGAGSHIWNVYTASVKNLPDVQMSSEGVRPVWLTLEEAKSKELTSAVRYLIEKYSDSLRR